MLIEEVPPYRIGFAGDLQLAEWFLARVFSRKGLLPPKYQTLFAYFCRRWSGKYCGAKRVRTWVQMWRDACQQHDFDVNQTANNWE